MMIVVLIDMLVEGIYFDLMYSFLKYLGYKFIVVNFFDIYVMNVIFKQVMVFIVFFNCFLVEVLEELYDGIKCVCEYYQVDFVGGDIIFFLKGLYISVMVIG